MMIKLKVPDFLRDDRVFFVENRLEKGRILHGNTVTRVYEKAWFEPGQERRFRIWVIA